MKKPYAGITIGPILETLGLTSSPLGLWFSSFFFSTITRDICKQLLNAGMTLLTVPEMNEEEKEQFANYGSNDGIGQFHDRIYMTGNFSKEEMIGIISRAIDKTISDRASEIKSSMYDSGDQEEDIKKWLQDYLQLHYIVMELEDGDSLCDNLASALDALELDLKIPSHIGPHILRKFIEGTAKSKNIYLKRFVENGNITVRNLYEPSNTNYDEGISDLETLAKDSVYKKSKVNRYFAIVYADGDNMGKLTGSFNALGKELEEHEYLKKLENQERRIMRFSKLCKEYAYESAAMIQDYGGIVIYAGGDDLMFLVPVLKEKEDGRIDDVWSLCQRIDDNFKAKFENAEFMDLNSEPHKMSVFSKKPSLSFGISINFVKYPLYESLKDAAGLLFGKAKSGEKNNIAISLHKHSGQSANFVMPLSKEGNKALFDSFEGVSDIFKKALYKNDQDNVFTSVLYHMEEMKKLLKLSYKFEDDSNLERLMNNILDNQGLDNIGAVREKVTALAKQIKANQEVLNRLNGGSDKDDKGLDNILSNMLRVNKFIIERGEEE